MTSSNEISLNENNAGQTTAQDTALKAAAEVSMVETAVESELSSEAELSAEAELSVEASLHVDGRSFDSDECYRRYLRRQKLMDDGLNPYPISCQEHDDISDLRADYDHFEATELPADFHRVAGRIRAGRRLGKVVFYELEDASGKLQLFCRINNFDEEAWELVSSINIGDIVEVGGTMMKTRTGELSINVQELRLLAAALRPLPEKFHGLKDIEMRYRQRYVDLIVNQDVRDTFRKRSRIISVIRNYMERDGYMEVETPILHDILGGANAKPFQTHYNALNKDCYLRIATELPLKRLIVGGFPRVFEIGRQFRNEGVDLTHNPEFTSMEAYCAYSDLNGMKAQAQGLFQEIARELLGCSQGQEKLIYQEQEIDLSGTWRSVSMTDLVSEVVGRKLSLDSSLDELRAVCEEHKIQTKPEWTAGKFIFELYDELCEQTLVNPTFVCDYPVEVSPLAKLKDDDPRLTDRFELVICGHEYANAFSELNDPVDQEQRFAAQMEAKRHGDEEAMEFDTDYIRALEYGMPPTGGIGYGIDRMIMLFCDQSSIRDVLLFPQLRSAR